MSVRRLISATGSYMTKDGREVRIYATDGRWPFPVHGAIAHDDGGWQLACWSENGVRQGTSPHRMNENLIRCDETNHEGVWWPDAWVSVSEELPSEGVFVDVWLDRGERVTDCYWIEQTQGQYIFPRWYFRNGFSVWKPFADQDVTHWRYPPAPPEG